MQFDPETGISKLDTDILFDSGQAVLKPGAEQLLDQLVRVLKSPSAGELKIMVAGHTDNQLVAGKGVREKYPNNFHLSTARAGRSRPDEACGPIQQRMAVAGLAPVSRFRRTACPRAAEESPRGNPGYGFRRAGGRLERFDAERVRERRHAVGVPSFPVWHFTKLKGRHNSKFERRAESSIFRCRNGRRHQGTSHSTPVGGARNRLARMLSHPALLHSTINTEPSCSWTIDGLRHCIVFDDDRLLHVLHSSRLQRKSCKGRRRSVEGVVASIAQQRSGCWA